MGTEPRWSGSFRDVVWDRGIHGDLAGLAYRVIRFLDERARWAKFAPGTF